MGKYLLLWEADWTKVAVDPKERGAGWSVAQEMVTQDLKKGIMKDWGCFVSEVNGYAVAEGSEVEITNMVLQYIPFFKFTAKPIASISQVMESTKAMMK
jgi:hypothetical protein